MPLLNLSISQFLWVFVAANLLKKLGPNVLFLRWLASKGLLCYRVPDNNELKKLQHTSRGETNRSQPKSSRAKTKANDGSDTAGGQVFKVKGSDLVKLNLKKVIIDSRVLASAPYGEELEWVVDLACMSMLSFLLIEALFYFSPRTNEYNFSLIWVFLVIMQCLLHLLQLTSIYFRNDVSIGERSICIVSGCIFLLLAMLIFTLDETHLELGVDSAFKTWNIETPKLPDKDTFLDPEEIVAPTSKTLPINIKTGRTILTRLTISVFCALVGMIFTFPGFRFGQLHESFLTRPDVSMLDRLIHNFNYMSSAVAILLWVPAVSRDLLKKQDLMKIDDTRFELIRIVVLLSINLIRFILSRRYTEIFLASSGARIDKIRYRGGTTTNKEIQLAISSMNNYVNVVNMQYILPTLICLFTSIMYASCKFKELTYSGQISREEINIIDVDGESQMLTGLKNLFGNPTFISTTEKIMAESRQLLASDIPKNVFGFAVWWFHFSWFCTSTAGVVYHKYFYQ